MRTIITSVALAACATVFAQNTAPPTPQQDTVQHVQSIYDECLLTAGTGSWQALGLTQDQILRVSALQARYKESSKAAEAKAVADEKAAAKAKGKGKVKKEAEKAPAATSLEQKKAEGLTAEQPEVKQVDPQVEPAMKDNTALEPPTELNSSLDKEEDFSAATGAIPPMEYSPLDAELRAILTPGQLVLWERRCDNRTSFKP